MARGDGFAAPVTESSGEDGVATIKAVLQQARVDQHGHPPFASVRGCPWTVRPRGGSNRKRTNSPRVSGGHGRSSGPVRTFVSA